MSRTSNDIPISRPPRWNKLRSWWQLPLSLALLLLTILLFKIRWGDDIAFHPAVQNAGQPQAAEAADKVSITIYFAGERKTLSNTVPWHKGMTVRGLLSSSSLASFGERGKDASAFLVEIGGVKNEGDGGQNWMYYINDKRGDRSFAIYELQPADHVLWRFEPPQ